MKVALNITFITPEFDLRTEDAARYTLDAYGEQLQSRTLFGSQLLDRLFASYPYLVLHAAWFSDAGQPEDTFVMIDSLEHPFAVQIDPDSEHIVIWDTSGFHIELGNWNDNPDEVAFYIIYARYVFPSIRNA